MISTRRRILVYAACSWLLWHALRNMTDGPSTLIALVCAVVPAAAPLLFAAWFRRRARTETS